MAGGDVTPLRIAKVSVAGVADDSRSKSRPQKRTRPHPLGKPGRMRRGKGFEDSSERSGKDDGVDHMDHAIVGLDVGLHDLRHPLVGADLHNTTIG